MKNIFKAFWKRPIKLWEWGIYAGIIILVIFVFIFTKTQTPTPTHSKVSKSTNAKIHKSINPQISESFSSIKLIGQVHSNQFAMIHPRREGLLKDILVDVGDEIQIGQTLAFLFPQGVAGQSSSQIAKAKAQLIAAEQNLANTRGVASESISVSEKKLLQAQTQLDTTIEGGSLNERSQLQQDLDHAQSISDAAFQNTKKILYGDTGTIQNASALKGNFNNSLLENKIFNQYKSARQNRLDQASVQIQIRSLEILLSLAEELYQSASENSQNHLALQKNRQNVLAALDRLEKTLLRADQLSVSVKQATKGLDLTSSQSQKSISDAQNRVQVAQEAYQNVLAQSGHVRVTAPFDGVIVRRFAEIGHNVHPSKALFAVENVHTTLGQENPQEIHFGVPESWMKKIKITDEILISLPQDNKKFPAQITSIGASFDAMSRTAQAQAVLDTPQDWSHNTSIYVHLLDQENPVWSVPSTALKRKGSDFYLWIIQEDESLAHLIVQVLAEDGEYSDVKSELLTKDLNIIQTASSRFFRESKPFLAPQETENDQ